MKSAILMIGVLFVLAFAACNDRGKEMGKSTPDRADSLFYGIKLGMTDKQFFDHCFLMNREKIFFQSATGVQVTCTLTEGFNSPVAFHFFPNFHDQKITSVKGSFVFALWAPFQPKYSASKLLQEIIVNMEEWYGGNDFEKVETNADCLLGCFEKIDLNRRITLQSTLDDQKVIVFFEDLKP